MSHRHGIQHRLVLYVSLCLLIVSGISAPIAYRLAFAKEWQNAVSLEQQLVNTVQAQAEVAVYADNAAIAEGVIGGLQANPHVLAVRIAGTAPGSFTLGSLPDAAGRAAGVTDYPLFSPVDGQENIGTITLARNDALIEAEATASALHQTLWLLLHILITALLIMGFTRRLVGLPVARLADQLAAIKPGSGARVQVPPAHADDEIGSLAASANTLIEAAETALAEVQAIATTDALTGLLNRRAFMAGMADELARLKRHELLEASVLMLDLDHFKRINDDYGHAAGDFVLQHFGAIVAANLRQEDRGGRIGGEEFAILLPATDVDHALAFAERLRGLVAAARIPWLGKELQITVSIGIAGLAAGDAEPGTALASADRALYAAKHAGRNRVLVDLP